jgi:hypothetical protein
MTLAMGATLCLLAGAVAAAFGGLLLVPAVRFAAAATASARGTVIGHDQKDSEEATYYYLRVAFTAEGREWVVKSNVGHLRPRPPVGTQVRVRFPPGDPGAADLSQAGGLWLAVVPLVVGVGLMLGAVWELLRT